MPRLPSAVDLERPTPRPATGLQRYQPAASGEALIGRQTAVAGQEISQTGEQLGRLVHAEQEKIDHTRAEEQYNKLRSSQLDLTYGQPNGFLNLKGGDAVNTPILKDWGGRFNDTAKALEGELANDRQKELYRNRAGVTSIQFKEDILRHQAQQGQIYDKEVFDSTIQTETSNAIARYDSPQAIALSLDRINRAIDRRGRESGLTGTDEGKQIIEGMRTQARSNVVMGITRQLVANDPLKAEGFFKAYKDELTGDDQLKLEHEIRQAVMPVEARQIADGIMAPTQKGGSRDVRANLGTLLDSAHTQAEKQHPNDSIFRDLVDAQIKGQVNTIATVRDGVEKQAHSTLTGIAIGTQGGPKPMTVDQLLATPGARQSWSIINPESQRGILAILDHNAKEAEGRPIKADGKVVEQAFQDIHRAFDDPKKITTPGQLVPLFGQGLDKANYEWLVKEIDDLRTPEGQRLAEDRKNTIDSFRGQFDKSTAFYVDPKGGEQFNKFRQYVMNKERQLRNSVPPKDPYTLYDSTSKDYIGKDVPMFLRSLEQQMTDMANSISGVGPIDFNKPVIQNPYGTISTERTITVESQGKHYLVPTIVGGQQKTNEDAIKLWKDGKNQAVGTYGSAKEAEKAAVERSKAIGQTRKSKVPPAPEREKRIVNDIYETPKGDLRWTGTGWVQP